MKKDDELLAVALMARNFSAYPSDILQIENEVTALDFDLACSLRLQIYDNKQKVEEIMTLAKAVAVTMGFADAGIFETE